MTLVVFIEQRHQYAVKHAARWHRDGSRHRLIEPALVYQETRARPDDPAPARAKVDQIQASYGLIATVATFLITGERDGIFE
jgi:hypothetical protein